MKNTFLLLLTLISINLFSQDPKLSDNFIVKTGEEYKETDGIFKQFYKYKDYVVAINSQKKDLVIQKINSITLKETERIVLEDFMKVDGRRSVKLVEIGEKVIFFYESWNKTEQVESLMAVDISLATLKVSEPYIFLSQQGKVVRSGMYGPHISMRWGGHKYFFKKSFDDTKLLVAYQLNLKFEEGEKRLRKFSIRVYDSNLNEESNEIIQMPYTIEEMENVDFTIDAFGNFYMIARIYKNENKDEKDSDGKTNYYLSLLKVKAKTNEVIINKIDIGNKFIDDIALYDNGNGGVFIAGTCKNPDKDYNFFTNSSGGGNGHSTGIFTVKLTNEGNIDEFVSFDFPIELFNKNRSEKDLKKFKKNLEKNKIAPSLKGLKLNSIAVNGDGSIIIMGEQVYRIGVSATKPNGKAIVYRGILAAKINADGTLAWMHKLPKNQRGTNFVKGTMSFTHLFAGDFHYLVFLDNVKNLQLKDNEVPYVHSDGHGGYFTAYIINDTTGEVRKEAIFNVLDINGVEMEHFDTDKILSLSDSEILIEGFEGRSKDFLVKVSAK